MPEYVTERERRIPVFGDHDVVVVGGGVAGAAAAIAAARTGASVALVEKETGLGGLATLGLVIEYLPLCDGTGRQVVGGLGEEFIKLSVREGPGEIPSCWLTGGDAAGRSTERYQARFNAATFMLALEDLALSTGVTIYYDSRFSDVARDGDRIEAVILENKSGRGALSCRTVVDASGDADVCARAGEETVSSRTNVAAGWYYLADGDSFSLQKLTQHFDLGAGPPPAGDRGFAGDDGRDVTEMVIASHELVKKHAAGRRESEKKLLYPFLLPTIPCFRMTRRLKGAVEIEDADQGRWFDDCVGFVGHWMRKGPVYCIPFRALAARRTENLLAAGRCMSVAETAWNATRVIPGCAVSGQAAGTAAALACRGGRRRFSDLDVDGLQRELGRQEAILDRGLVAG